MFVERTSSFFNFRVWLSVLEMTAAVTVLEGCIGGGPRLIPASCRELVSRGGFYVDKSGSDEGPKSAELDSGRSSHYQSSALSLAAMIPYGPLAA